MALSKKDQINIKLEFAKETLAASARRLDLLLSRDDLTISERDKLKAERDQIDIQLKNIFKLFESLQKKQKARLILAFCNGVLKDGTPCDYKIRASMSALLRYVPTCRDPFCSNKGKEFEIELKDEEIETQMLEAMESETPEQRMAQEVFDAKRRDKQEKERAVAAGLKRFEQQKQHVAPRTESAQKLDATFSQDDSAMFYDENERKPSEEERAHKYREKPQSK